MSVLCIQIKFEQVNEHAWQDPSLYATDLRHSQFEVRSFRRLLILDERATKESLLQRRQRKEIGRKAHDIS